MYILKNIVRKSPEVIKSIFGAPSSKETNPKDRADLAKCDLACQYQGDKIDVLYYNNEALWLSFTKLDTIPWTQRFDLLGLKKCKPDKLISGGIEWYNSYPDLKQVAFIPSSTNPNYLHMIVVNADR